MYKSYHAQKHHHIHVSTNCCMLYNYIHSVTNSVTIIPHQLYISLHIDMISIGIMYVAYIFVLKCIHNVHVTFIKTVGIEGNSSQDQLKYKVNTNKGIVVKMIIYAILLYMTCYLKLQRPSYDVIH